MRAYWILLKKELNVYRNSPVTYLALGFLIFTQGLAFSFSVGEFTKGPSPFGLVQIVFNANSLLLFWMPLLVIVPLLTMRLFAEEKKLGTIETLFTAPVNVSSVVLAKYTAALILFTLLWLPSGLNFRIFEWVTGQDAIISGRAYWCAYALILLLGAQMLAVGCFGSALTSNQLLAALLTFTILLAFFAFGFLNEFFRNLPTVTQAIVEHVSASSHMRRFSQGLFDTRPLFWHLSLAAFFLFLTYTALRQQRGGV
ncbi:MAG: ABC transporter permease [Verrucomicrobiota bacterium]